MSSFFLGMRVRTLSTAFACFGLAAMAPAGIKGFWPFLLSPPGLGVVSIALLMLGVSVEETGTVRRIRIGVGLKLAGFFLLCLGAVWACWLGAPTASLSTLGWALYGIGLAGSIPAFLHDKAVFYDIRHGQRVRLEKVSVDGMFLSARGGEVVIPMSLVRGAVPAQDFTARGVIVLVSGRDKVVGPGEWLPWASSTLEGDAFVLTEHEAGLDADVLARQINEAAEAAKASRYR